MARNDFRVLRCDNDDGGDSALAGVLRLMAIRGESAQHCTRRQVSAPVGAGRPSDAKVSEPSDACATPLA